MPSRNERTRQRYAQDPAYRERTRAINREAHARRYADPDKRQRILADKRAKYAANKHKLAERHRQRYLTDPQYRERRRATALKHGRKYHLRKNYGLSIEAYEAMRAAQGGVCAICKQF